MVKARKCCCTPEPYKHLLYLVLYRERVRRVRTKLGGHLCSDFNQDFS